MKFKALNIIIISLILNLSLYAEGLDREYIFKKGVSAYAAENYNEAVSIFTDMMKSGKVSWELYYNLGNSYYRLGNLGQAIQYWEKAKLLAPSQPDINYNLSVAEQLLVDKVVLPKMFPLFKWYAQMQKQLPLNTAIMSIGILILLMVLILIMLRYRDRNKTNARKAPYIAVLSVFLSLILIFTFVTVNTAYKRKNERYAIILKPEVHILSEPDEDATVLFILHEGSKVKINKNIEDIWSNISYFDDKVGWIPHSAIGVIEE